MNFRLILALLAISLSSQAFALSDEALFQHARAAYAAKNEMVLAEDASQLKDQQYPVSYTHLDVYKRQPLGMSGMKLKVKVHIVTGAVAAAQNIVKCIKRCGIEVSDLILQPLASSLAVLTEDEKELGVCLVDIGGGTTDIAVFKQGAIRHTAVVPIAGDQMTNDVAVAFRTPTQSAEDIKIKHGCALRQLADPREIVEVPGVDLSLIHI